MNLLKGMAALLAAVPLALAAETGYTVRPVELMAEPSAAAAVVGGLPAEAAVEVGSRRGGWYLVQAEGRQGWLPMLSLRFNREARREADSGLGKLSNLLQRGNSGSAVATGVRGLDEAALRDAQPDEAQLQRLEAAAVAPEAARAFAAAGERRSRPQIDYLPEPNKPAGSATEPDPAGRPF